jgi:hypothetical protein
MAQSTCGSRAGFGSDWKPAQVLSAHRKLEEVRPYRRFFQAYPVFAADQNAQLFYAGCLNRRLPQTAPELIPLLQK